MTDLEINYGYSKPNNFFKQLKDLCVSLEKNITSVKKDFSKSPGSYPVLYDEGMKSIKSEVTMLKEVNDEVREKVDKIKEFDYFVQSMRDLLTEQIEDVKKMETYLEKYGYKAEENLEIKTVCTEKINEAEETRERPQLRTEPTSSSNKIPKVEDDTSTPNKFATPVRKREAWYLTPTPYVSSMRKVEQWIESVQREAYAHTGENKSTAVRSKLNFASPSLNDRMKETENKVSENTPEEPLISSFTTLSLKKGHSNTPEEPVVTATSEYNCNTITPEDPDIFGRAEKKKQLEMTSLHNHKITPGTPPSPELSDYTKKILNFKDYDRKRFITHNYCYTQGP